MKIAKPTYEEVEAEVRAAFNLPPKPKPKPAEVVEWPKKLSEIELIRRQAILDQTWERVLWERRQLTEAEEAEKRIREFIWGKLR